jgi:hypothetical protein
MRPDTHVIIASFVAAGVSAIIPSLILVLLTELDNDLWIFIFFCLAFEHLMVVSSSHVCHLSQDEGWLRLGGIDWRRVVIASVCDSLAAARDLTRRGGSGFALVPRRRRDRGREGLSATV